MRVELRGTISASLGVRACELALPEAGLRLGKLLEALAVSRPRASRYLAGEAGSAVLRVVHNGLVLESGDDPLIQEGDSLLLLQAVAGGTQPPT